MEDHSDWQRWLPVPVTGGREVATTERPTPDGGIGASGPDEPAGAPAGLPAVDEPCGREILILPSQQEAARAFARANRAYRRTMDDDWFPPRVDLKV